MQLTPLLTLIPYLHGRHAFAEHVRSLCLGNHYDCIAVDLPECFAEPLAQAVSELPYISAVAALATDGPVYYAPSDPCDATIEAIRQSQQNHLPCLFIGYGLLEQPPELPPLPDEHAIGRLGFDAYASLCLRAVGMGASSGLSDLTAQYAAFRLHDLCARYRSILALVHMRSFTRTISHFGQERSHNLAFNAPRSYRFRTWLVNPDHLYFALGELPFVTGQFEQTRLSLFAREIDPFDTVKNLFRETRDEYYDAGERALELSPSRLQVALTFLRNLTVMSARLMPDLFDIVEAAKGVGGNSYAVRILKSAKYYPFLPIEADGEFLAVGIDQIMLPGDRSAHSAVNLFRDTRMVWKRLSIKPDPSVERKRRYRFRWNPLGMCSHIPEDRRIESFNVHVRKKAKRALCEDLVKTEKFTTSVKDGIDVRTTLRNWYTGHLYVKEIPPSRGDLDTVVIIFDETHDERYPHCATWYAEHDEESTLTFYATDQFADTIGPGIARCRYGGLSLLFPPRPIPNVFSFTRREEFDSLAQQLTYGATLYSGQRNVAYIAPARPGLATRALAQKLKKHLVWIPLGTFSSETLRRLQRFHVLNGKVVRSWASRFIGD